MSVTMRFTAVSAASKRRILIDDMLAAYVQWREACASVQQAYDGWTRARAEDEPQAFRAYTAALDDEARASELYADLVKRVEAAMAQS